MKEFTGVQLQVVKALEKSIQTDKARLEKLEEFFIRQNARLEDRMEDLKGKTAANRELIQDSIDKSLEALKSFMGADSVEEVVKVLEMRQEAEDFDEVMGLKAKEEKKRSVVNIREEEEDLGEEPFKNIFK